MIIAVTGASGQLGRIAIEALKTKTSADQIVGLARAPEKLADLGVQARAFDYNEAASLAQALAGVKTLALISASEFPDRVGQHRNVIEAAKAAGVERIVYTSILKADTSPLFLAQDHKATEAILKGSGLDYTFLRNSWYTENWTGSAGMAVEHGAVVGTSADAPVTPATRQDLGEALAIVAADEGHKNAVYELGGDVPFTMSQMAAEIAQQASKPVAYNDMPAEAYHGLLSSLGLPEGLVMAIVDGDVHARDGWLATEAKDLSKLLGRPTTPLATAVKSALG